MFFKENPRPNPRQAPPVRVKKASEIINSSSHKQKKYVSLMFVPSYSKGKTRSLRVPRSVFYCVIASLFVVSAVIAGLQIRAAYLMHVVQDTQAKLDTTMEEFLAHQWESDEELNNALAANQDIASRLTGEQLRAIQEETRLRRDHQLALKELQDLLDSLEQQIQDFDDGLAAAIAGLSKHSFIPPVSRRLDQLHESQAELRELLLNRDTPYTNGYTNGLALADTDYDAGIILLSTSYLLPPALSEEDLHARIEAHKQTLQSLTLLKEDFIDRHAEMEPYIKNYPTRWPVRATISSGFGWRDNPFGPGTQFHRGVDIPSARGTAIHAAGGGTVIFSGWDNGGLGNKVVIDHGFGMQTLYAHNNVNLVTVGQRVERGDIIARVGITGQVTGPHVHYEVHVNGVSQNPRTFLLE
jgi:murein DD-endopeptidase MepM/ murein hydrolase activator NlpD